MKALLTIFLLLAAPEEEIDHVALAAVLIQDGHYDRAAAVLNEVDPEQEGLDLPRYHMLMGLVALKSNQFRQASVHLQKSIQAGQTDKMVWVFLAQALFALQEYPATLKALDAAGEAADELSGSFLIRAQCHWRAGDKPKAYDALQGGLLRHPGTLELLRHKVMLLIDLGLFQQALEDGSGLLAHKDVCAEDYVAIAEALRRGKQLRQATLILEEALLRYPDSEQVFLQLARTYLEENRPLTAGALLHRAARRNPALMVEAAELYRRAGSLLQALHTNAQVKDQQKKIRQRLGLFIELGRFEEAAAMEKRLSRLRLLKEEPIAYALAYSNYRTGRLLAAEEFLRGIRDPGLYQKAIELRRAIEVCRKSGWTCE